MRTERASYLLAHLSDPHLPLTPNVMLRDVMNKRALSLLSWNLSRRRRHRRETLNQLVDDLAQQSPDHIAVTGDLVNLGLAAEYVQGRTWLESLGDAAQVSVIPGNHEAMVRGAWEQGATRWYPYWQDDATDERDVSRAFPYLRCRGSLALIGLSSATASRPGRAVGAVGKDQLSRLGRLLVQTRESGFCRVVMIHHPPLEGTVSARKRLLDGADLRAVLAREGVELVLHGHSHRSHWQELDTAAGSVPVIGVPSASSMHHEPAAYNLYRIAPEPGGWALSLTIRRLGPKNHIETAQALQARIPRAHAAR